METGFRFDRLSVFVSGKKERLAHIERDRVRERHTHIERDRVRETHTHRERDRVRERHTHT